MSRTRANLEPLTLSVTFWHMLLTRREKLMKLTEYDNSRTLVLMVILDLLYD